MTTLGDDLDDILVVEEVDFELAERDATRRRRRTWMIVLVLAFVATRAFAGYVADHPGFYGPNMPDGTGDVARYDGLSWAIRHDGLDPYGTELRMEYPPAAIPVIMTPRYVRIVSYHTEFVVMMVLADALGLLALVRIAQRGGSWWGAATWFVLVPALGPVSYTRLDLLVAVLLVWTLERALAGRWEYVGLLIGVGAALKLVPAVLLPLLFFVAPRARRRAMVGWFALVVGVAIVPWIDHLGDLYTSTIRYHTERSIQAESIYGAAMLAVRWFTGYTVLIVSSHHAWDAQSDASAMLTKLSEVLGLAAVAASLALAVRTKTGQLARAVLLVFGALSLVVATGKVYSPQYIVWLIALGAVAMAIAPRVSAPAVVALAVVTVLAHLLFPVWFWDLLFYDKGGALLALVVRNVLTFVTGGLALWAWYRLGRGAPSRTVTAVAAGPDCHTPWGD